MSEEIKERLSKTEYEKVGEMLLELIAECPFVPEEMIEEGNVFYQSIGESVSIGIYTLPGGRIKSRDILGGFTAELPIQIQYKSLPRSNQQRINAQHVVDRIMVWLEDIESLPKLKGWVIVDFESSNSFSDVEEVESNKYTIFASNAVMEYRKKGVMK